MNKVERATQGNQKEPSKKKSYVRPEYESELIFETAAIQCGKRFGECQTSVQDS